MAEAALSRAGKATLVKSVVESIPTYTMSTFRIPKDVCEIDALIQKFWWSSNSSSTQFMALVAWKKICNLKKLGGLGFRRCQDFNFMLGCGCLYGGF